MDTRMPDGKIVMIVDDDRDDRFFFKNAINDIEMISECRSAENGLEALEKLRKEDVLPDFIFLDLNMPQMNGWDCLRELKKDIALKSIPVIIYSTSDYKKDIELATELGAGFYLVKSFEIFSLPQRISEAIEKASQVKIV